MSTTLSQDANKASALDFLEVTLYGISKGCIKCEQTARLLQRGGVPFTRIDVDLLSDLERDSLSFTKGKSAPFVILDFPGLEVAYHWNDMRLDSIAALTNNLGDVNALVSELERLAEDSPNSLSRGIPL